MRESGYSGYRRAKLTKPESALKKQLSTRALLAIVGGLVALVAVALVGGRLVSAAGRAAPAPVEQAVVREQVTGEFDPAAESAISLAPSTHQEDLNREAIENLRNSPDVTAKTVDVR